MQSGANRVAGRDAIGLRVRDAQLSWLQQTYEAMCADCGQEPDESIMNSETELRAQFHQNQHKRRTQYATWLQRNLHFLSIKKLHWVNSQI